MTEFDDPSLEKASLTKCNRIENIITLCMRNDLQDLKTVHNSIRKEFNCEKYKVLPIKIPSNDRKKEAGISDIQIIPPLLPPPPKGRKRPKFNYCT